MRKIIIILTVIVLFGMVNASFNLFNDLNQDVHRGQDKQIIIKDNDISKELRDLKYETSKLFNDLVPKELIQSADYDNLDCSDYPGYVKVTVDVVPGWNIIGLTEHYPKGLPGMNYGPVYYYDASSQQFVESSNLKDGGFYIYSSSIKSIQICVKEQPSKLILKKGWNLISVSCNLKSLTLMNNPSVKAVYSHDYNSEIFKQSNILTPGKGYWVYSEPSTIISYECLNDSESETWCGDGDVQTPNSYGQYECCDHGADPTCRQDCSCCGDGDVQVINSSFEQCDDGNEFNGDLCDFCYFTYCGDDIFQSLNGVGTTEYCDGEVYCRDDCTFCGDSVVQDSYGETCDDDLMIIDSYGNCRDDCTFCGDELVNSDESCELGEEGCRDDCHYCGDGTLELDFEQCEIGVGDWSSVNCNGDCTLKWCGDHDLDMGETCDPPNIYLPIYPYGTHLMSPNNNPCRWTCTYCGDEIVQNMEGEECDDGNSLDYDYCSDDCSYTICGDDIIQNPNGVGINETCDGEFEIGAFDNPCRDDCTYCGDGIIDVGTHPVDVWRSFLIEDTYVVEPITVNIVNEICDPLFDSTCRDDCSYCGDGVVQDDYEYCDVSYDLDCRQDCTGCGDGIIQVEYDEICDDGNNNNSDSCDNSCNPTYCGDEFVQAPNSDGELETCDGELDISPYGNDCRGDCTYCGDGIIDNQTRKIIIRSGIGTTAVYQPYEICDPLFDSTCRDDCTYCGDGIVQGEWDESCDPLIDPECSDDCGLCGDGVVNIGEDCDDGNDVDYDACKNDCSLPFCGDNVINDILSETCDPPGYTVGHFSNICRGDCTYCGDGVVQNYTHKINLGDVSFPGISDEVISDEVSGSTINAPNVVGFENDVILPMSNNWVTIPYEICDPLIDPTCRDDCTYCGDGIIQVESGEVCDPNAINACFGDIACSNECECKCITTCAEITAPGEYNLCNDIYDERNTMYTESGCINILSDNVSINGNGHIIYGGNNSFAGISLIDISNVNVTNCNISNFYTGVGIWVSDNNIILNNVISDNEMGITIFSSSRNTIINNMLNDNPIGISVGGSLSDRTSNHTNNLLIDNNIKGSNLYGIYLVGITNNTVNNNLIDGNPGVGISLMRSSNNTIINNIATNNHIGISLSSTMWSISSFDTYGNNLTHNIVSDNLLEGIYLESSISNFLINNTANGNGGDGFKLFNSSYNYLINNNASGRNYNGIHLSSNSNNNTLSYNRACYNGNYGIYLPISSTFNSVNDNNACYNYDGDFFVSGITNSGGNNHCDEFDAFGSTGITCISWCTRDSDC